MITVEKFAVAGPLSSPDSGPTATDEGCVANIGPRERRKRLVSGIVGLGISLAILAVLLATGVNRWWRLPLFFPFAGAGFGFFQWQEKTCVALARRQVRIMGEDAESAEKVQDEADLAQIHRQVNRVQLKALLAAIALTLVALALP